MQSLGFGIIPLLVLAASLFEFIIFTHNFKDLEEQVEEETNLDESQENKNRLGEKKINGIKNERFEMQHIFISYLSSVHIVSFCNF